MLKDNLGTAEFALEIILERLSLLKDNLGTAEFALEIILEWLDRS